MNKKLIGVSVLMLIILTIYPVAGLPSITENINQTNFFQTFHQSPSPGDTPRSPPLTILDKPIIRAHPEKTAATIDDIVISMLEQVDETSYIRYLENLTAFGPRVTESDACKAAAEYIYKQFENMGLNVRYHHWDNGGYSADNVEATIAGTDESSDEIYIICAHYDTVSSSPGADDDASGTIAVLMAAYIMSQSQYKFNHTIKFVVFSGEEQHKLGSQIYAVEAAEKGWNIVGVLNADMISYAEATYSGNNLIVFQNDASKWLYNYTYYISTEYADYIHLTLHNGGLSSGSDHYYFWIEGYSALFYFEYTMTPFYHTADDTIANINASYVVKNMRLLLATLAELSESSKNNVPNTPIITGKINGDIQTAYDYTIQTTDPDQHDIKYQINWGDNTTTITGLIQSGVAVTVSHIWDTEGTYSIIVKAIDEHNAESDWATLTVTMPYSYDEPIKQLFEGLFQRFLNTFALLQKIMRY